MFQQLLGRELQRQQQRSQFCDIVLEAQGVFVPVHSCVLSAFSPRLCEFLASAPAMPGGQSRVIGLKGIDTKTLLGLVSLIYTGRMGGDPIDLQAASQQLGIIMPLAEREVEGYDEEEEEEDDWSSGDDIFRKRRKRSGHEKRGTDRRQLKDAGTQVDVTQDGRKCTVETDTQTECVVTSSQGVQCQTEGMSLMAFPPDPASLCPISEFPWVTEECFQMAPAENPLITIADDDISSAMVLPSTLDDAMVSQLFGEGAYDQTGASATAQVPLPLTAPPPPALSESQPRNASGLLASSALAGGGNGELVEGFEQFEGNIPDFISYFLDGAAPKRKRGRPRGNRTRGSQGRGQRAVPRQPGRGTKVKVEEGEENMAVGRQIKRRFPDREGRSMALNRRGIGGGRVGRWVRVPPRKKGRSRVRVRQQCSDGTTAPPQDVSTNPKPRRRSRKRPALSLDMCLTALDSALPTPPTSAHESHLPPAPSMLLTQPLPTLSEPRTLLEQLLMQLPSCVEEPLEMPSSMSAKAANPRMLSLTSTSSVQQPWQPQEQQKSQTHQRKGSVTQQSRPKGQASVKKKHVQFHLSPPSSGQRSSPRNGQLSSESRPQKSPVRVLLTEDMFEERRMTRNQAKHLVAPVSAPQRPLVGKNMQLLRNVLLGKRSREDDEEPTSPERPSKELKMSSF